MSDRCENFPGCACGDACEIQRLLARQRYGVVDLILVASLLALALFSAVVLLDATRPATTPAPAAFSCTEASGHG
ncbi:hypothetical protein GA830_12040 [Mesorhizobium sp. NBSH29]|uniref:hypothetical protein n=1 Tax=Mesorhizobium sp. NBSH29 TaxID=2654249 RepID=UPI0018967223|nr:hypothetical protein [Mesorhizobium sp. NBSH29]QPC87388.1 hypothetical protein GA830_12040 [Mesorhizobium sp. NBSH29]